MEITYREATNADISELIRLRMAYIEADFGKQDPAVVRRLLDQLPGCFERNLGKDLFAFIALDGTRAVASVFLKIAEMPANPSLPGGLYGEVLNVYTDPDYRGNGICTQLLRMMIDHGKRIGLGRIDLSATNEGYPIYNKVGFREKESHYTEMRYEYHSS